MASRVEDLTANCSKKGCNTRKSMDYTFQAAIVMLCAGIAFSRVSFRLGVPWCAASGDFLTAIPLLYVSLAYTSFWISIFRFCGCRLKVNFLNVVSSHARRCWYSLFVVWYAKAPENLYVGGSVASFATFPICRI